MFSPVEAHLLTSTWPVVPGPPAVRFSDTAGPGWGWAYAAAWAPGLALSPLTFPQPPPSHLPKLSLFLFQTGKLRPRISTACTAAEQRTGGGGAPGYACLSGTLISAPPSLAWQCQRRWVLAKQVRIRDGETGLGSASWGPRGCSEGRWRLLVTLPAAGTWPLPSDLPPHEPSRDAFT